MALSIDPGTMRSEMAPKFNLLQVSANAGPPGVHLVFSTLLCCIKTAVIPLGTLEFFMINWSQKSWGKLSRKIYAISWYEKSYQEFDGIASLKRITNVRTFAFGPFPHENELGVFLSHQNTSKLFLFILERVSICSYGGSCGQVSRMRGLCFKRWMI